MRLISLALLALLCACAPPRNVQYCQSFGLQAGTPSWNQCMGDYQRQQMRFDADRASCSYPAFATYPPSLDDRGHYARTYGGIDRYGWPRHERIFIPPDYHHNAQLDALRERLIAPCMHAKGWNDSRVWEAGRH